MRIIQVFHISFSVVAERPVTPNSIRQPQHSLPLSIIAPKEEFYIVSCLTKTRLCPGKLDVSYIRMLVRLQEGKDILLDGNGCVRFGSDNYYILPGAFLGLHNRLEALRNENKLTD